MRSFFVILAIILPNIVLAACKQEGVTVVYINGIFTSKDAAIEDLKKIYTNFIQKGGDVNVQFINGYNPSHFEGAGDLAQAYSQILGTSVSSYDRNTILLQIHPEVTTRRLLLVGHSQGTFYANEMYEYLLAHGEPREAVGVYNIASPATYVAGDGKYLNSTNDHLLNWVQGNLNNNILSRNIFIAIDFDDIFSKWPGHGISRAYLTGAADRMADDLKSSIKKLKPTLASDTAECFTPPERTLSYKTQTIFFSVADPLVSGAWEGVKIGGKGAVLAFNGARAGIAAVASVFNSIVATVTPEPRTENLPGSFSLFRGVYGSSLTEEELKEFGLTNQGGAVALTFSRLPAENHMEEEEVLGVEVENPSEPLIPPPTAEALSWPGFGGGAQPSGGGVSQSPSAVVAVSDGIPPSLLSLSANGFPLQSSYASLLSAPLATSGTLWQVRMEFDEELGLAPQVFDSPPNSLPRTSRAVDDCGDTDARTFCFSYPATPTIEASSPSHLDEWTFEVSNGVDVSGEVMAIATYSFAIDTLAPAVTAGVAGKNTVLPIVDGLVSQDNATVQVLVNGHFFTSTATANYWFVQLSAGQELSEGYFAVQASSTDSVGNWGPAVTWQILVDLINPTVQFSPAIADGDSISSTTPSIAVVVADNNTGVTHACEIDSALSNNCTGVDVSGLSAGPHTFKVVATDVGGNQTTLTRSFTVLP